MPPVQAQALPGGNSVQSGLYEKTRCAARGSFKEANLKRLHNGIEIIICVVIHFFLPTIGN